MTDTESVEMKKKRAYVDVWFIVTLTLTSQPTLMLGQNSDTYHNSSHSVRVVTPKTSPF